MTDDPPFRAEHVGSLLRPRALKEAGKEFGAGTLSEAAYAEVLDRAVADAVRLQESVGLRVITDGEFRRASWMSGFFAALDGFALTEAKFVFHDADGHDHRFSTCRAVAKIKRTGGIATEEFAQVQAKTDRVVKATLPTPSALHFFALDDCADRGVYPDLDEFWDDLIAVYQEELAALAALGARYVQLDEVPLAMLCDPAVRDRLDPVLRAFRTSVPRPRPLVRTRAGRGGDHRGGLRPERHRLAERGQVRVLGLHLRGDLSAGYGWNVVSNVLSSHLGLQPGAVRYCATSDRHGLLAFRRLPLLREPR